MYNIWQFRPPAHVGRVAKFSFSKNHGDLKYEYFFENLQKSSIYTKEQIRIVLLFTAELTRIFCFLFRSWTGTADIIPGRLGCWGGGQLDLGGRDTLGLHLLGTGRAQRRDVRELLAAGYGWGHADPRTVDRCRLRGENGEGRGIHLLICQR